MPAETSVSIHSPSYDADVDELVTELVDTINGRGAGEMMLAAIELLSIMVEVTGPSHHSRDKVREAIVNAIGPYLVASA